MTELTNYPRTVQVKRTRTLWIEFIALGLYLVVPGWFSLLLPSDRNLNPLIYLYSSLLDIGRVLLVFFVVWVADGTLENIGISRAKWIDLIFGICLFVLYYLIQYSFFKFAPRVAQEPPDYYALARTEFAPVWMSVTSVISYAVVREVIARGYAISRLRELLGGYVAAIAICLVIFEATAFRDGVYSGMLSICIGLLASLVFVLTKRIWPGVLAHAMYYSLVVISTHNGSRMFP